MHKNKAEIDALTGLRFFAALWVFLYHIGRDFIKPVIPELWPVYKPLFNGGGLGVDLFFILSGFVIAYNYYNDFSEKKENYFHFLFKRFARIYPVHLFTLCLLLPVSFAFTNDWFLFGSLESFFHHLVLLNSLSVPVQWNNVSWSISSEWFAYCTFPIYIVIFVKCKSSSSMMLCMTAIYLIAAALFFLLFAYGISFTNPVFKCLRIFSEFGLGILVYRLWVMKPQLQLSQLTKKLVIPLSLILIFLSSHQSISFLWIIPYLVLIIYLAGSGHFFNTFLSHKLTKYGGKLSYSLYMVHGMVMVIFLKSPYFPLIIKAELSERSLFVSAYIIATILLTFFCYHFVEEPARKLLLSFRNRH